MLPSQVAEMRGGRVLSSLESSKEGPWDNDYTPALVAIMDASAIPGVHGVTAMKGVQQGGTEAVRLASLSWSYQSPRKVLWVLPDENASEKQVGGKLKTMFLTTRCVADQLPASPRQLTHKALHLKRMSIVAAWAGSESSLASEPYPVVVIDEADKMPLLNGQSPLNLARKRQTTFRNHPDLFTYVISTPTTRQGPIWLAWDACPNKLHYYTPCPHCETYHVISFKQVKWPDAAAVGAETRQRQAEYIEAEGLAWYECPHCGGRVDEAQRRSHMIARGVWGWDGDDITMADIEEERARVEAETGRPPHRPFNFIVRKGRPWPRDLAFHLPSWCGPWVGWHVLAAEFLKAQDSATDLMDFRNQYCAEPFEQEHSKVGVKRFEILKQAAPPPRIVPDWATCLIATADTQKDHWWYVIRAWGAGFRSQLVDYGRAVTGADLIARTRDAAFPIASAPEAGLVSPYWTWIDAGGTTENDDGDSRTYEVYRLCLDNPGLFALRGHGGKKAMDGYHHEGLTKYRHPGTGELINVPYLRVNTDAFKSVLSQRINQDADMPDRWDVHTEIGPDYMRQLTSEHQIIVRTGKKQALRWVPISVGAANHLWDCEVYQCAGASLRQVHVMPTILQTLEIHEQATRAQRAAVQQINPYTGRPIGQ